MTELNRTSCGDGLHVCTDANGDIRLQWGGHVDVLSPQAAALLCCWLMRHLPASSFEEVPAGEFITSTATEPE